MAKVKTKSEVEVKDIIRRVRRFLLQFGVKLTNTLLIRYQIGSQGPFTTYSKMYGVDPNDQDVIVTVDHDKATIHVVYCGEEYLCYSFVDFECLFIN
jgi:hypothetical protein